MRALKILLASTALSLPAVPAIACPEDGGDHRFFAFASLLQTQQGTPESSQDREQPAPQGDGGASDQAQPQPDQSSNPRSSPTDATDAATFR